MNTSFSKSLFSTVLILIALSYQGCDKTSVDDFPSIEWQPKDCAVHGNGGLVNAYSGWVDTRARFSGSSKIFTLQLMSAGTFGSFISPGKGWLTISLHLDTEEMISIPITNRNPSPLPAKVALNEATILYTDVNTGQNHYVEGVVKLGRYRLSRQENRFEIDINLDNMRLPNGQGSFYGDLSVEGLILPATASPSSGSNSNCNSCGTNTRVANFKSQCQNSISQAPCYCAAAAIFQCYLDNKCYKEAGANTATTRQQLINGRDSELAKARQLGTTCW